MYEQETKLFREIVFRVLSSSFPVKHEARISGPHPIARNGIGLCGTRIRRPEYRCPEMQLDLEPCEGQLQAAMCVARELVQAFGDGRGSPDGDRCEPAIALSAGIMEDTNRSFPFN